MALPEPGTAFVDGNASPFGKVNTSVSDTDNHELDEDDYQLPNKNNTSDLHPPSHQHFRTPSSISSLSVANESVSSSKVSRDRSTVKNHLSTPKSKSADETMVLQVRTVALSSVHPQNAPLAKFFLLRPNSPRCLSKSEIHSTSGPWRLSREEIRDRMGPERTPGWHYVGSATAEEEQNLIQPTVDISKSSTCPASEITTHFIRMISQLWRATVSGVGEPSLLWANPASLIPLRLHSFATLLTNLSSVTVYMSKSGVTQLDGRGKWSLTSMGRIVSLLFDEESLFLDAAGFPLEDYSHYEMLKETLEKSAGSKSKNSNDPVGSTRRHPLLSGTDAAINKSGALEGKDDRLSPTRVRRRTHSRSSNLPPLELLMSSSLSGVDDTTSTASTVSSSNGSTPTLVIDDMASKNDASSVDKKNHTPDTKQLMATSDLPSKGPSVVAEETASLEQAMSSSKFDEEKVEKSTESSSQVPRLSPTFTDRKVDTKSDFQLALNTGSVESLDGLSSASSSSSSPSISGSRAAKNMISAFGGMSSNYSGGPPGAMRRRWMTAPSSALATIQEDNDTDDKKSFGIENSPMNATKLNDIVSCDNAFSQGEISADKKKDTGGATHAEMFYNKNKESNVFQMRVPQIKKSSPENQPRNEQKESEKGVKQEVYDEAGSKSKSTKKHVTATDDGIEAFLDVVSKNLGYGVAGKEMGGEEKRVGHAHHRKTQSRCSIDWTLPHIDVSLENQQQIEIIERRGGATSPSSVLMDDDDTATTETDSETPIALGSFEVNEKDERLGSRTGESKMGRKHSWKSSDRNHPFLREKKASFEDRESNSSASGSSSEHKGFIELPGFIDRIASLGIAGYQGRWFPYTYEVVIFQWVALLVEQTKDKKAGSEVAGSAGAPSKTNSHRPTPTSGLLPIVSKCLSDSASRARGVTISCAPILFEVIKKSLGWRIDSLFRKCKSPASSDSQLNRVPLVTLDDTILATLEELISMVTDACIDSRNFDSWNFRQTSIDVNNSIVRFLRDLFAFLEPVVVHRLILVYFSRFVMKEGKHWRDSDSKIGLRCSFETCKLRLNAITLFVRFPDFLRVNVPLLETWDRWPFAAPHESTRAFFSKALEEFDSLAMPGFAATEGPIRKSAVEIPSLKPHWLVELVTDVCLSATGHAEQSIQHRASSLLHELFWSQSREGKVNGTLSVVSSMYVPFVVKILGHINYLSSLPAKSQLRKDILPCVVFVLQSAPVGLMTALWRKLCRRAEGKGRHEKFGGIGESNVTQLDDIHVPSVTAANSEEGYSNSYDDVQQPSILDIFSLLNLALKTFEYEGSETNMEDEIGDDNNDKRATWRKEYLLAIEQNNYANASNRHSNFPFGSNKVEAQADYSPKYTTSSSRKWCSHDAAIIVINTSRYIVRETLCMLKPSSEGESSGVLVSPSLSVSKQLSESFINKSSSAPSSSLPTNIGGEVGGVKMPSKGRRSTRRKQRGVSSKSEGNASQDLHFTVADTVIFARATTSVYLHSLSLNQSDIVTIKTLIASVEIVKIFGIKVFLAAVGETLQHWMRVVLVHCGGRRAEVRVEALDFLALILRLTWDSFGSFFRVRMPLLAVQTEVMDRIVATAATRHYSEQRRLEMIVQYLTNDKAEASLAPLWKSLDRLHTQSASHNVAFRSALERLAGMMKKLYRAYIAAHALAIVNRVRSSNSPNANGANANLIQQPGSLMQKTILSVHRIVNHSAGYSKQFLGLKSASTQDAVTHNEAVEDAFLAAAEVFSSTELPSHRVAWLRKLAEFHASRAKFAEEATCRFHIHSTLRKAACLHDSLWNSVPFLPWASDSSDGVQIYGDGPAGPGDYLDADYDFEDFIADEAVDNFEVNSGKQIEKSQFFRRIFYRVANSVRMRTGDWDVGGNKNLFYGVTFASEYNTVSPWISLREMEEDMVEEAETAGDLYLKAGIVESSRFAWSLATQFYSETFNYGRLAYVYRRLALVVASQVPVVDTSNQLELSSPLGRFYRVWFHGGAPDELIGAEFVYRAASSVKLEEFGKRLCQVLKSILPDKTPIDLVLDDGRPEDPAQRRPNARRPLSAAPREAVKIKVTPLRPLMKDEKRFRGTPEWFYQHTDSAGFSVPSAVQSLNSGAVIERGSDRVGHTAHLRTSSRSIMLTPSSIGRFERSSERATPFGTGNEELSGEIAIIGGGQLVGVEKFSFTQPIKKDRLRGSKDWLKAPPGDCAEKSLRVTQITVEKCFPACVSRQAVVHRAVFTQSPLEAGVEAVCSWCAVLFRTAVATNGLAVIGTQTDQGIGTAAAKVVADCIHCSRVKEMGQALLKVNGYVPEEEEGVDGTMILQYAKLTEEEIRKYQMKLARAIVMFLELLHLLIARNRDLLLAVVQARKRRDGGASVFSNSLRGGTGQRGGGYGSSPESTDRRYPDPSVKSVYSSSVYDGPLSSSEGYGGYENIPISGGASVTTGGGNDRTDSAIAVQSELQRAFVVMAKVLNPLVSAIIHSETPRWLKRCSQESYFSSGTYRHARIAMGEELLLFGAASGQPASHHGHDDFSRPEKPEAYGGVPLSIIPTRSYTPDGSYAESSAASKTSEPRRSNLHRPSPTHSSIAPSLQNPK